MLALAVNHDGSQQVIRGWPLVMRVSATFDRTPAADIALPASTLALRVTSGAGSAETWPLEGPRGGDDRVLDAGHRSVEVMRSLPASATEALAAGPRTLEVTWGPARAAFAVTVVDPPPESEETRAARALLEADALLGRGDAHAAVAALDTAIAASPDSVALLNQRALAREQGGDDAGAFADAEAALAAFRQQFPDASEPPVTILEIRQRLLQRIAESTP